LTNSRLAPFVRHSGPAYHAACSSRCLPHASPGLAANLRPSPNTDLHLASHITPGSHRTLQTSALPVTQPAACAVCCVTPAKLATSPLLLLNIASFGYSPETFDTLHPPGSESFSSAAERLPACAEHRILRPRLQSIPGSSESRLPSSPGFCVSRLAPLHASSGYPGSSNFGLTPLVIYTGQTSYETFGLRRLRHVLSVRRPTLVLLRLLLHPACAG